MADYDFITASGVILPDTGDLQATVEAEFRAAFGADIAVDANTPQGVLITAEVLARAGVVGNNAAVANQLNPNLAGGVFLDAIWALTGGSRFGALPSRILSVTLSGQPGSPIPAGAQASVGVGGAIFETITTVTLGADGTAAVDFQAVDAGPTAAPIGTLDTIVSGVLGWETVSNPAAAILGQNEETDQASRIRRRNTLALQATSIAEAVLSAVSDVAGVSSCIVRENYTSAPVTIEGVTLAAHSIFVCVDGGADADVAAAILSTKSLGCDMVGTTTVNVVGSATGQTYPVKFQRPTDVPIYMTVSVRAGSSIADPPETVRAAIIAYAAGQTTLGKGFGTGDDVSPFELAAAVNFAAADLFVADLQIGTAPGALSPATVAITIAQRASIIAGNIAVSVT